MGRGGELPDGGGEGPAAAGGGGGEMQDQEEEEEGVHPVRHVIARILFFGNFFFSLQCWAITFSTTLLWVFVK